MLQMGCGMRDAQSPHYVTWFASTNDAEAMMRTADQGHDLKGSGFRPRCLPVQEIMMKHAHFFTITRPTHRDYLLAAHYCKRQQPLGFWCNKAFKS